MIYRENQSIVDTFEAIATHGRLPYSAVSSSTSIREASTMEKRPCIVTVIGLLMTICVINDGAVVDVGHFVDVDISETEDVLQIVHPINDSRDVSPVGGARRCWRRV